AEEKLRRFDLSYDREMVSTMIGRLEEIYNENVTGVKYKIGLWMGAFFDGKAWDPPVDDRVIFSLRLNDRLQYTVCGSNEDEFFVYVGGFADVLAKEVSNSTSNRFFFSGLGYTYRRVSFALSGFFPTEARSSKGGVVLSIMYDIPIEKLIAIF
ncbi:MAG: hypothetical protein ACRDGA_09540, partial [Bacteroidota bacterium]